MLLKSQGTDGRAAVEGNGRSVEGEKGIIGEGVSVVDILLDDQGIVGGAVAEGEKDIIVDGVNETISFKSKELIGGSMVTKGCLVDRFVKGVEDCERSGDILTSWGENNASVSAVSSVGTRYTISSTDLGCMIHCNRKAGFLFASRRRGGTY